MTAIDLTGLERGADPAPFLLSAARAAHEQAQRRQLIDGQHRRAERSERLCNQALEAVSTVLCGAHFYGDGHVHPNLAAARPTAQLVCTPSDLEADALPSEVWVLVRIGSLRFHVAPSFDGWLVTALLPSPVCGRMHRSRTLRDLPDLGDALADAETRCAGRDLADWHGNDECDGMPLPADLVSEAAVQAATGSAPDQAARERQRRNDQLRAGLYLRQARSTAGGEAS